MKREKKAFKKEKKLIANRFFSFFSMLLSNVDGIESQCFICLLFVSMQAWCFQNIKNIEEWAEGVVVEWRIFHVERKKNEEKKASRRCALN